MGKIKVGVIGAYRGNMMIKYGKTADNAELVAICDKHEGALAKQKELDAEGKITFYKDFDEFLKHDMDAVVLANYATEHAPFAIKALKAGKHVFSEVLPCQTLKQAVELIETIEETGLVYAYGENYCYMPAPSEMRKLYKEGKIGEFEYGECEYIHNCENRWHSLTYGDKDHWRNNLYSTFYCTHSLGPIIHITGLRPVRVTGFEGTKTQRNLAGGSKSGQFGMEIVELENGGIVKSIHGGLYKNSIWYSVYGSKGRMESAREDEHKPGMGRIYVNADEYPGEYGEEKIDKYDPTNEHSETSKKYGHGGSDFYSMYNFIEKIKGNENAETIDVFEALDMFLPGMFAYRSILAGNVPVEIPDFRNKDVREKYRNDTTCTDPKVAGDMLIPSFSLGNPDIPDEVYEAMAKKWDEECQGENDYVSVKK